MWKQYNVTTVRKVGQRYKICNLNMIHGGTDKDARKTWAQSGVRMDNSIARARTMIKELAYCNDWQWFVTLTVSPDLHDRYDLNSYHRKLTQFIKDQNKRRDPADKIIYILIPEKHQDGAWHMHGLLGGLQEKDLYRNEYGYWGWKAYERSFGYLSLGAIKDKHRCINYVCKYVSKSLAESIADSGAHLYYRSRGLNEPVLVFQGHADYNGQWDWEQPEGYVRLAYAESLEGLTPAEELGEELYAIEERWGRMEEA